MSKSIEKAQLHVRKTGHTLGHHDGPRPWSAIVIQCQICGQKWHVLRSEAPCANAFVADLNATVRDLLPTAWDRVLSEDFLAP